MQTDIWVHPIIIFQQYSYLHGLKTCTAYTKSTLFDYVPIMSYWILNTKTQSLFRISYLYLKFIDYDNVHMNFHELLQGSIVIIIIRS